MATNAQTKKKKNSRIRKSRQQKPLVEEAVRRINRFRGELAQLEWDAKFSERKGEREKALLAILEKINGLHKKQGHLEGRGEMHDACHYTLERIAAFSQHADMRNQAFDFVLHNPVAVVLIHKITPHPDIKGRSSGLLPKQPNIYYEKIGVPVESNDESYRGISMRLLANLRKDSMDPFERREMLGKATRLIKKGTARWGPAQDVIGNLMKVMNAKMEKGGNGRMSRKDLADCIEAYLSGKPDRHPVDELEEAFEEVRKIRY